MQDVQTLLRSAQRQIQAVLSRREGRIAVGAGLAVVLVLVGGAAYYVFGAGGPSHYGTVSAPTLTSGDGTVFTLDSSSSQATFTINEILFGRPNTVVGKTNAVAGQIRVDTSDPSKSQVGEIRIDLSSMLTDNDFRNRALQGRIFETDNPANQYATFTAAACTGLPTSAADLAAGKAVSFKITGNLTIHQVTKTVTFDATVTPQSATELTGEAHTTVKYRDFNLAIPNVPSVAGVSDDVVLAISFTAKA
jgi:polyisoprenoid-binding protein YceI